MDKEDLDKIKKVLFVLGGVFAAILGAWFSKNGFNIEMDNLEMTGNLIGWGLAMLCFIVQIAFSSQLAYGSYNYVIFVCGVLAYIYSGWSNWVGIMGISPTVSPWFALMLAEFLDWIAEPLIVFGLVGVMDSGEGDFLRNLMNRRPKTPKTKSTVPTEKYIPTYKPKTTTVGDNHIRKYLEGKNEI